MLCYIILYVDHDKRFVTHCGRPPLFFFIVDPSSASYRSLAWCVKENRSAVSDLTGYSKPSFKGFIYDRLQKTASHVS